MDDLLFARLQMAISLGFHIIFAVIGIGLPVLMLIAEWRWLRSGDTVAKRLAKHWAKGTAIFFAVGAVSGTVLSFELGLLWPRFMEFAGGIIGLPFALEGFAFFTEAIFLGIYLYAWDKIRPWAHFAAGCVVALSGVLSAVFVLTANAWMNTPAGFTLQPLTGVVTDVGPIAAMMNPAWKAETLHMVLAAYLAAAIGVAGVHAWRLARRPGDAFHRKALALTMPIVVVTALAQPLSGDYAAHVVAATQPAKLAAMEGQFRTERRAPLRIGGLPDEDAGETRFAIEIPGLLSLLAYGDTEAEVKGLLDFPRADRPPAAITHVAFQIMIACGVYLIAVSLAFAIAAWRRKSVPVSRPLLAAIALGAPLAFVAIESGWIVTEVGRQPWIIQGVLRTRDAVTPMPGIWIPCVVFTLLYVGLAVIVARLMHAQIRTAESETAHDAA